MDLLKIAARDLKETSEKLDRRVRTRRRKESPEAEEALRKIVLVRDYLDRKIAEFSGK